MRRGGWRIAGAALIAVLGLVGVFSTTGCTRDAGVEGPQQIAGGGTAGIYYNYGDQLAHALQRELGLDIEVAETQGSVDNLRRVGTGEALLGFAQGDTAADAIAGSGAFSQPLEVRGAARVYDEYVHIVVPADSDVQRLSDFAGKAVSLGAPGSGVHVIATRVLEASGVGIASLDNPALPLDESIQAMVDGEIEGFFWVGGLPTPGIERLQTELPIRLVSIDADIVELVNAGHAGVYQLADFPLGIYGTEAHTVTMTVPNYLIAAESAPDAFVEEALRVLFESRSSMARSVASVAFLDRRQAIFTGPLELHPGAATYYVNARR